jgi:hypothetical protein
LDETASNNLVEKFEKDELVFKPGWVRISIHPTNTFKEIKEVCDALLSIAENYVEWQKDYVFLNGTYLHSKEISNPVANLKDSWFEF